MQWTPTRTPPPAYERVLLWWPCWCDLRPVVGYLDGLDSRWVAREAISREGDPPTHWMPLPKPPIVRKQT
jgi:hypothetical protein